ncbi:MAG TPA: DinB family protein [Thermoanaerobaculia bacterium]
MQVMEKLRAFHSRLLLAIHGVPEADLVRPEREGKWSVADVIAHLGDLEMVYAVRIRTILSQAGGDAPLPSLAQDEWVERVHRREPLAELLEQFWFHRRMNLALRDRLSEEERARTGVHPQYGAISIDDAFGRIERHDEKHLAQIERIKTTLGLKASDDPDLSGVVPGSEISVTSPGDGVRVRTLWKDGVKRALEVEFDPGAQWPGIDYHVPGPEEVYVLSGDFDDGANVYRAGSFLHHPAGSSHSPKSVEGCKLFVFYPEG